jgi:hypothetical protein
MSKKRTTLFLLALAVILSCNKKPKETQVARIGDRVITVDEFRRNYEFGLSNLKAGPDRKAAYLNFMINEMVLAQQGYHLGLQNSDYVKRQEETLTDELLVEALFDQEVKSKITVTPEEVRAAALKAKVSWKLRYWYEPNAEFAGRVRQAMVQRGYAAVVDEILGSNAEVQMKPKDFETDYVTWIDVPEEVLAAVENLPLGEISQPVELEKGYYLFQVADIRRQGITDFELKDRAESWRQILFYRKMNKASSVWVNQFMTPKNVATKSAPFRLLADAIQAWARLTAPERPGFYQTVTKAQSGDSVLFELNKILGQNLVTFNNGSLTMDAFLKKFDPGILKKSFNDLHTLRSSLNEQIALQVRDRFMAEEAKKKKLDRLPSVQKELSTWRDKWVFEECRRHYGTGVTFTEQQAEDFFKAHVSHYKMRPDDQPLLADNLARARQDGFHQNMLNRLQIVIDSLKTDYPVVIHKDVLDTINTVEFEKSRWASMQVYKRSTNRMAVPIVDPGWGVIVK